MDRARAISSIPDYIALCKHFVVSLQHDFSTKNPEFKKLNRALELK